MHGADSQPQLSSEYKDATTYDHANDGKATRDPHPPTLANGMLTLDLPTPISNNAKVSVMVNPRWQNSTTECSHYPCKANVNKLGGSTLFGSDILSVTTGPTTQWTRIDATIDSGSAVTCIPFEMVPEGVKIDPVSDGPANYISASNNKVEVVGQITVPVAFENGVYSKARFKVLKGLKKPLLSAVRLSEVGWDIHISRQNVDKSYAALKGKRYKVYKRNGVITMPMWIDARFLDQGHPQRE